MICPSCIYATIGALAKMRFFKLVIVLLIGSLQRTLYQVARPVSEYTVDSFFSCVL